jgi:hypothetical protein
MLPKTRRICRSAAARLVVTARATPLTLMSSVAVASPQTYESVAYPRSAGSRFTRTAGSKLSVLSVHSNGAWSSGDGWTRRARLKFFLTEVENKSMTRPVRCWSPCWAQRTTCLAMQKSTISISSTRDRSEGFERSPVCRGLCPVDAGNGPAQNSVKMVQLCPGLIRFQHREARCIRLWLHHSHRSIGASRCNNLRSRFRHSFI